MGRRKNRFPLLENIEIEDIAAEGKALARVNDKVVFVSGVVPGDVVDIQVKRRKKSFMEGTAIKFHSYSSMRTEAFCSHFGICGGCKWQMLPYDKQLEYKQKQVVDQLTRIGKLGLPEINPILGSEANRFYRNKLEFTFSTHRWLTQDEIQSGEDFTDMRALGFHIPKMFDRIIHVDRCFLQPEPSNAIRNALFDFAISKNYPFWNHRDNVGFFRNVMIRNTSHGELMLIMIFGEKNQEAIQATMEFLAQSFPEITSLYYIVNLKVNDSLSDQAPIFYKGKEWITEYLEDLQFRIGPKSFFQTNTPQALRLYQITRQMADLKGTETVYDLYTGTGSIAQFVARNSKKVIGIEYVPEAIEDAKINAGLNKMDNLEFYAGDMKDVLSKEFIEEKGKPDVVILDPPRAGVHASVIERILETNASRIVYVSCNPATQARDLALMAEKYQITEIQPVDMFPHTHHVENVVRLDLKNR